MSFRRISAVKQVLNFQSRYNNTEPEDEWFGKRIIVLPKALVASAVQQEHFSVEDVWHEKPMGYHVPEGGTRLHEDVWKDQHKRQKIFEYCPELSMIMPMKLEAERYDYILFQNLPSHLVYRNGRSDKANLLLPKMLR